ncbi:unnamed protein product [Linum tenue]|uniref:Defensin-like protein n=2 Tax=Linum tenue TaxID=586396 RepID=A0AAV0HC70_9ROSI|nr:unnamed protein product [Linum tenue]
MMKRLSWAIIFILLLICLFHGNEVVAFRSHEFGPKMDFCDKFTSFPQRFLHIRGGGCKDSICDTACNNMFGGVGIVVAGRCEQHTCACYDFCYHYNDPPLTELN